MRKSLILLLVMVLLAPGGYAIHQGHQRLGSCESGFQCAREPGAPFPPDAVSGHAVYASWVMERDRTRFRTSNATLGLPTDFAAIAGFFLFADDVVQQNVVARAMQRECVVWFNGMNLDQRPSADAWGANTFPSDEDFQVAPAGWPDEDAAYRDYEAGRDVPDCRPRFAAASEEEADRVRLHGAYAVAVERGDCAPGLGSDHRFRAHLDFVDPNGYYHEVQEYDYVCGFSGPLGRLNPLGPGLVPGPAVSALVKDFFPWTYTDPHNERGCRAHATPRDNMDPAAGDPGYFDLGHKCNGSVQDLFTERMWITPIHERVHDPTLDQLYTFALQVDTCAGVNMYETSGKPALGEANDYRNAQRNPGGALGNYHGVAYHRYYSLGLDGFVGGWPLFDVCTDGSSFSFDDTPRGRVVHTGPPTGVGGEEIMRGNSYDFTAGSPTFGKHRTNCRVQTMNWPMNTHPQGPPRVEDDCYVEDHKTAQVDIWVYTHDPTGRFLLHANHGTGHAGYIGPGVATDARGNPH